MLLRDLESVFRSFLVCIIVFDKFKIIMMIRMNYCFVYIIYFFFGLEIIDCWFFDFIGLLFFDLLEGVILKLCDFNFMLGFFVF